MNARAEIYKVARQIPRGKVATYGQIAELAGLPGHARQVGYAMGDLPEDSNVPWHRVVNAKGAISMRSCSLGGEEFQRELLEEEGVVFGANGRIRLADFRWDGQ